MASSIIESMSSRKLGYFLAVAMIVLFSSFLIGGLVSPTTYASMQYLATKCIDDSAGQDTDKWFWSRGKGACKKIEHFDDDDASKYSANHIVFTFQMPLPRDSKLKI